SAMARGAVPTATSPSLARVTASNAVTLSLSALTTHRRGLPLAGVSTRTLVEAVGARGVAGRYTACVRLRLCTCWLSSVTITVAAAPGARQRRAGGNPGALRAGVREQRAGGGVRSARDAHAQHLRDRRHGGFGEHEDHVDARGRFAGVGGRRHGHVEAGRLERQ